MKPWELFDEIWNADYSKSCKEVDWALKVYDDEKIIRLLFQGSVGIRDWLSNFIIRPFHFFTKQNVKMWVAAGWAKAYKIARFEIFEALIPKINEYKNKNYKLEICGYSCGGVMAILTAEEYYDRTNEKVDLITFGCPKSFFGARTAEYFRSTLKSIVQYANVNDFVARYIPIKKYKCIDRVYIGGKFNLLKLLNVAKYHTSYGDKSLYELKTY